LQNIDPTEIAKFNQMASTWWDPNGPCQPLHQLNPIRLSYITSKISLEDKITLDIGCGGGILTESLAIMGAQVTGLDLAEDLLTVARLHWPQEAVIPSPTYVCESAENFSALHPEKFDVITCMELIEHVPSPSQLIQAIAKLLKPGGHFFCSTLNRTPTSYLTAIIGAEYILAKLPKGTHDYKKFLKPHEITQLLREAGLTLNNLTGVKYNVLRQNFSLSPSLSVNYLLHATKS
jgi:2-polyprenyl-6-hydroxyphenyl methylase/3-demethylubiquinone-9 3-methyltransferase